MQVAHPEPAKQEGAEEEEPMEYFVIEALLDLGLGSNEVSDERGGSGGGGGWRLC